MESYESRDVMAITGVTKRQVTYWPLIGLVHPEIKEADGRSTRRVYSEVNLYQFWVVKKLFDSGFDLRAIKKLLPKIDLTRRDCQEIMMSESVSVYIVVPELRREEEGRDDSQNN
jgi:DNA-binding transcriptional MerR regulator